MVLDVEEPGGLVGALDEAAEAAAEASEATEDANGSVEYKQNLVRVLVGRAWRDAVAEAAR